MLARPPRREWPRWLVGGLIVAAAAALLVCAAYLFLDVATPLGSRHWLSRPMKRLASALPWLRLPLPAAFLTGYDASLAAESGEWNVVILGHWYPRGVWFYFAVLWLLKTPLLVLAAELWGLVLAVRSRLGRGQVAAWLMVATLAVQLGYFSLVFHTQVGYRFVLMCVPLAYLLAAAGIAPVVSRLARPAAAGAPTRFSRRAAAMAGAAVVALAVFENAMYFGNPLSFTNAAVWPKKQAFRLIADSNLDWGQHDAEMEAWSRRPGVATHLNPLHFLPGHDTFSVNEIAGVSEFERHRFLRENADPAGQIGHTHVWFDVDAALFDRFMDKERRFESSAGEGAACPSSLEYEPLSPTSPAHVFLEGPPGPGREWLVCLVAPGVVDLGLRALRGRVVLARYRAGRPCQGETVDEGQESWHRLSPGVHALCAVEVQGLDPTLPHPFEGSWLAHGGAASIARPQLAPGPAPPADPSAASAVDAPARPR